MNHSRDHLLYRCADAAYRTPHDRAGSIAMTQASIGPNADADDDAIIGYEYDEDCRPARIGEGAVIRAGSIIYGDVEIGEGFVTGHDVVVREDTTVGDDVLVGTKTVVDGSATIGSDVSIQTNVYIPPGTTIGDRVFVGPGATFTNDKYPLRQDTELRGPTLGDDVSVGANAVLLPGVTIGDGAFVAAGAIVTDDVPPGTLAIGAPATTRPLPERLDGGNQFA